MQPAKFVQDQLRSISNCPFNHLKYCNTSGGQKSPGTAAPSAVGVQSAGFPRTVVRAAGCGNERIYILTAGPPYGTTRGDRRVKETGEAFFV